MGLRVVFSEVSKGQVLVKRSWASGLTVETQRDFGLGATGPRPLAPPGLLKTLLALTRQGKRPEKHLASSLISTQNTIGIQLPPPQEVLHT